MKHDSDIHEVELRLSELESEGRALEPMDEVRSHSFNHVLNYTTSFLDSVNSKPAYIETEDRGSAILNEEICNEPSSIEEALSLIEQSIDRPGLNPASGGHLAYVPGGGIPLAALGDLLAAITNRYAGVYYGSPGAVRLENLLIRWMSKIIGFPDSTLGNLTSGGSIANLIAVVTARDARQIRGDLLPKSVIYATDQAHHCLTKAIRIAGLADCQLRFIVMDGNSRMDLIDLSSQIAKDKELGLNPFMVMASAGTTDTGAVDPLDDIAVVCKENHIWFHVDGAFGGFFVLCEGSKSLLAGMRHADSVVLDPHKGLFLPYGSGAVLIRDGEALARSHHYQANYLQDALNVADEPSPADLSPELTKHFRALRMWLPLIQDMVK